MASKDITPIIEGWEPQPDGGVTARIVQDVDGTEQLQLRLDLGVLQMGLVGRPDGTRPGGKESLLALYRERVGASASLVEFTDDEWGALDAEIMQYYHRRIGMLATASRAQARSQPEQAAAYYSVAAGDGAHNLAIMDFIRANADDEEYIAAHEHYRPLVLCHQTLAASQAEALNGNPEAAIDAVLAGIAQLEQLEPPAEDEEPVDLEEEDEVDEEEEEGDEDDDPDYDIEGSIRALQRLQRELRRQYNIDQTLRERLDQAVADEDYEEAARLRDELSRRSQPGPPDVGPEPENRGPR